MEPWVVGIDLGGTKIELGLVDHQNRIVARCRIPTRGEEGPQAVVERIAGCVSDLEAQAPSGVHASALGICCPGPIDHENGILINPVNLPRFHNAPLRKMLVERLHLPVSMDHDAKAAALGEYYFGAGRGEQSMVYTVVGTGVGSAIIIDGQLYRGMRNFAGEGGHITADPHGELCHCGTPGCVETFTSGPWLARRYRRLLESSGETHGELAEITGKDVADQASAGDPLALKVMNDAGEALGIMVASMAMILDIELYVFGGSVPKSGDLLLEPARRAVPRYCFHSVSSRVRIAGSQVGDDGPVLGCSWQARQLI
jgi:glucokinase